MNLNLTNIRMIYGLCCMLKALLFINRLEREEIKEEDEIHKTHYCYCKSKQRNMLVVHAEPCF